MIFIPGGVFVFGLISYQRGWAKRAARKAVYQGLLAKLEAARQAYSATPTLADHLDVERFELFSFYEGQKGRVRRRFGVLLMIAAVILALLSR